MFIIFISVSVKKEVFVFHSQHKQIEESIQSVQPGTVFAISDFSHISVPETCSKVLTRLSEKNKIVKVFRGVFWKPDGIHEKPEPDKVAKALARNNRWKAIPCGETVLYLLGLVSRIPAKWTYITDGTYRSYECGDSLIEFHHTTGDIIHTVSEKTALLIQTLKAYGKDRISDELLITIHNAFKIADPSRIMEESKLAAEWISNAVSRMFYIASKQS